MFSRFPKPDLETLPISNGDTIQVRKRLTQGERNESYARMYVASTDDDGRPVYRTHPLRVTMAQVLAYLVDWSLVDDDGEKVPIKGRSLDEIESALNALDPMSFGEIRDAIDAHETRIIASLAQKKTPAGPLESSQS